MPRPIRRQRCCTAPSAIVQARFPVLALGVEDAARPMIVATAERLAAQGADVFVTAAARQRARSCCPRSRGFTRCRAAGAGGQLLCLRRGAGAPTRLRPRHAAASAQGDGDDLMRLAIPAPRDLRRQRIARRAALRDRGRAGRWRSGRAAAPCREDRLTGGIIAPGFIDLQVNGGGGRHVRWPHRCSPTLRAICAAHARLGATGSCRR